MTDAGCGPFIDDAELASASFGQGRVVGEPAEMALLAASVANGGVQPDPYVVRDVRPASAEAGPLDTILDSSPPGEGHQVMTADTAAAVRALMVDAVQGPLGQAYAGSANVVHYGISGVDTAGKTGTAQRGGDLPPHSWFIGFVPAGPDDTRASPSRSSSRAPVRGRLTAAADCRPDHGRMAPSGRRRLGTSAPDRWGIVGAQGAAPSPDPERMGVDSEERPGTGRAGQRQRRARDHRQARRGPAGAGRRCCARATSSSRTCPASARRCSPRRSAGASAAASGGSSSRPTCCPPT